MKSLILARREHKIRGGGSFYSLGGEGFYGNQLSPKFYEPLH